MKIVVDDKIPFIKGILEPHAEVMYIKGSEICRDDVVDADALIIRTRTTCNKSLLEGTSVRFIATATIGCDHIDSAWCDSNGISWANAPGSNSGSVMQYVAAGISHLVQKYNLDFSDLTIGVIGVGNVGSKIVKMASAMGMKVLQNDPPREMLEGKAAFISLKDLLRQSDIVTMHVPLTFKGDYPTFHMADADFFSLIKKGSYFINTSRGTVCDENSLKKIIQSKTLAGCILDVWETEPIPDKELLETIDIATPHIAGYSSDGKINATLSAVRSLSHFFSLDVRLPSPDILPKPVQSVIDLTKISKKEVEALCSVILKTYQISADSELLKKEPGKFEEHRGNYWPRREFSSYTIIGDHRIKESLIKLGFLPD